MFTGLVEEIGVVKSMRRGCGSAQLSIEATLIFDDLKIGDSVCTNGVCLTVTSIQGHIFTADVMNETLSRSDLGSLKVNGKVNLERALRADSRLGGHIVSGHIDGTGRIVKIRKDDIAYWYTIRAGQEIMKYIVQKGSVAIDGISLTVARTAGDTFDVSVIPLTAKETVLGSRSVGETVNIENDIIGKYIEKFSRR